MLRSSQNQVDSGTVADGSRRRILIHASNLVAAGPKAVCAGLLPSLVAAAPDAIFTVMLPEDLRSWNLNLPGNARIRTCPARRGLANDLQRLRELFFEVRRVAQETRAEVCLTLGDYPPVGLPCPSVVFVHLALLAYTPEEMRGHVSWPWPKYLYLKNHFRVAARRAAFVAVQTEVMARRLSAAHGIPPDRIAVIPQPVPRHVTSFRDSSSASPIRRDVKPVKLTFLAAYYPHKNHEILPDLAAELRRRGLSGTVQIYTTIDAARCPSRKVRQCFAADADVITNLGPVRPAEVAALLKDSSAFFCPTLIESFGLTYLEALSLGLPILTSDRDFARCMCGGLARYFDPCDARSIAGCIEEFCGGVKPVDYAEQARQWLARFPPDWDSVGRMFLDLLLRAADRNRAGPGVATERGIS
jgi:glycosyltransferase involved in cell wall biosynthesis